MLKRLIAIAVLAAAAVAACNSGTPAPTLSLTTPGASEMPLTSPASS